MGPKFKFTEGERVLCYHGPLLYEAKCIKSQLKDKLVRYYIHYSGWNKNWDEWVPESRVLKYNEANVKQQKELALSCNNSKKTKAVKTGVKKDKEVSDKESVSSQEKPKKPKEPTSATSSPSTSTADTEKKKKPRAEQNVEVEEIVTVKKVGEIKMPGGLKIRLMDSMKKVKTGYLLKIPARKTVEQILEDYATYRKNKGLSVNEETEMNEIVSGIRLYFNLMLKPLLLVKIEKQQYADLLTGHPDAKPADLYGSFHLLRLFVKIGDALARHPFDQKSWAILENDLENFLDYLNVKARSLFSTVHDFENKPIEKA